ncbi:sensor domain-containing diguanylate cyclase [Halovibrio salipaludis]|uniref:diguanylate cyclase n=1 Tax=Halovibrio salipaludis TaxID=2032626 RepID=A0A2A2F268_9GAMM|nr:sensor domain-containing diguanylate cyclase [Halovibrio salipaludis]PAU78643.1 sensor domain-containing diguanylate cyclase [Halovibrio salipaludis]
MGQPPVSGDRVSALETIIDVAELGTWIWNVQTGETEFNDYWARMLGYTLEELGPTSIDTWLHFLSEEDHPVSEQALKAHFEGHASVYDCEVRVRHRDGRLIWIRDFGRVVSWTPDGQPEWVSGAHLDITSHKDLEQSLREESEANRELIQTLERAQEIGNLGYWKASLGEGVLYWSEKVFEIFGVSSDRFTPSVDAFRTFVHPEDLAFVDAREVQARQTGLFDVEHRVVRPDGSVRWVHARGDYTSAGDDRIFIGTVRDITEQKEQEDRLRELSFTDPLTQIPNRRVFMERLNESYELFNRRNIPAAVVMIDIDHFKTVNDTYGHGAGDEMIRHVAHTLAERVRESDVPCRLGGEEFGLLLPGTVIDEAMDLAERLRLEIAGYTCTTSRGETLQVTLSAGVSRFEKEDTHPEQALQRADAALYRSKATGRNRVIKGV